MIWELLFILGLILINGLFAAAETSLIAARKGRLEQKAEEGNRNARRALELSQNPDLFLPTAQIGISIVSALGAAYGGHEIVDRLSEWLANSSWPIVARHADGIALAIFVAPVVHFLAIVTRPLVWFMGLSTSAVLWVIGFGSESEPTVSLDDIEH